MRSADQAPRPLVTRRPARRRGLWASRLRAAWRRTLLGPFAAEGAVALAVIAAVAITMVAVLVVDEPKRHEAQVDKRVEATKRLAVAEDVLRRALPAMGQLFAGQRLSLHQGPFADDPRGRAWVEFRKHDRERLLVCGIEVASNLLLFQAPLQRGVVEPCLSWPFASLADIGDEDACRVEGCTPRRLERMPFQDVEAWSDVDVWVDRRRVGDRDGHAEAALLANFRRADERRREAFQVGATELDNFELGNPAAARIVAALHTRRDSVLRVRGHLWIGRSDADTLLSTRGRTILILVDGDVHIAGTVRLQGEADQVVIVAGRPGYASYRDLDRDGRRSENEPRSEAHVALPLLSPTEGAGRIWLASPDRRASVQLMLCATHDLVVANAGAEVIGGVLCRSVHFEGTEPLVVRSRSPVQGVLAPRGFPVVAGSEEQEALGPVRFVKRVGLRNGH